MKFAYRIIVLTAAAMLGSATLFAQSTNQNFPTPVTSTEINGTIKARDIGDARLTSYYFQFDGDQGDLFINIVTRNFTGDIDVFTLKDLRPLTKIVVYADFAEHETGRVIYLRKPEKMILRVQGRTPGDDPAAFRIKFAGSFVASTMTEPAGEPGLPSVTARNESGIRVNSVGTIVEVIPKATPVPPPPPTVAEVEKPEPAKAEDDSKEAPAKSDTKNAVDETAKPKVEVVVTDNVAEKSAPTTPSGRRGARNRRGISPKTTPADVPPTESTGAVPTDTSKPATTPATGGSKTTEPGQDPLQNINLVILFKDGRTIQRPMSEVFRFSVDKGILTVISKDGTIGRYSILEVAKVTIE
jgi:hypothetical protein